MFKRNSPDKNKACMGYVRETPPIKKKKKKKKKNEASTGCVRETPHSKVIPAWDVLEKLPR